MKWLHGLLKGASLTTALFIFQACYGTPQNALMEERGEAPMSFSVLSASDGTPLEGIHVLGSDTDIAGLYYRELGITDANGCCKVGIPYVRNAKGPFIRIEDPSGGYAAKDTLLYDLREKTVVIKLNQAL